MQKEVFRLLVYVCVGLCVVTMVTDIKCIISYNTFTPLSLSPDVISNKFKRRYKQDLLRSRIVRYNCDVVRKCNDRLLLLLHNRICTKEHEAAAGASPKNKGVHYLFWNKFRVCTAFPGYGITQKPILDRDLVVQKDTKRVLLISNLFIRLLSYYENIMATDEGYWNLGEQITQKYRNTKYKTLIHRIIDVYLARWYVSTNNKNKFYPSFKEFLYYVISEGYHVNEQLSPATKVCQICLLPPDIIISNTQDILCNNLNSFNPRVVVVYKELERAYSDIDTEITDAIYLMYVHNILLYKC